jgi:pimeloyl-ACP methyl ester carboxylesterase
MKELFLISGLGADRRVFEFLDLSGYNLNYINWIPPQPNESIEHYAQRLLQQIPVKKPILIGVSFGGMIAVEIGKLIETEKIILISSAKTRLELPWYFRLAGKLNLHRLAPSKPPLPLLYYLFGIKEGFEKELLKKNIVEETGPDFIRWAMNCIVTWKNETHTPDTITIHGANDRLLPAKKANHLLSSGGHFMIVTRNHEVTYVLRKLIDSTFSPTLAS